MIRIEYVASAGIYGGLNVYSNNLFTSLKKFRDLELCENKPVVLKGTPIYMKSYKSNLTHFTNQEIISPLITKNRKFIATVHDLTVKKINLFSKSESKFSFLAKKLYDFKLSALKNAEKIIAVSNHTKQDLVDILNIDEDKIKVIYEGVGEQFRVLNSMKKETFKLLCVGNELPHKNLDNLFRAIAIVKKIFPNIELVKVGSSGWQGAREKLLKLAKELQISNSIIFKNEVQNIVEEYNSANILIFPSYYEGFGLPILEAMACGCPVIASNSSSIPEVAGNAVLYFNPNDVDALAESIIKMISNNKLRNILSEKGLKRVKQFSWQKCAEQTREVYFDTQNN